MRCHGKQVQLQLHDSIFNSSSCMISRHLIGFLRKHGRISQERLSSTNLHEINPLPRRQGRVPQRVVFTLDPRKFAEKKQHPFRIGNLRAFQPRIVLHSQSFPVLCPHLSYYTHKHTQQLDTPFPPDTTAFLYYLSPPERPRIAGELRLRVASNDDPASFESGSDLLKLNGRPWSRSLYRALKYYTPLYEKLREDGLVPDDLHSVLSTLPGKYRKSQHLYTLNDSFILDFSIKCPYLSVITEKGVEAIIMHTPPFFEKRPKRFAPYTGSALVRFERSTLPEHVGTRTVVLRFLKILTPVKCVIPNYDGSIVPPKEGELHRKYRKRIFTRSNPPVWSIDIDKSNMLRSLKLLWDI